MFRASGRTHFVGAPHWQFHHGDGVDGLLAYGPVDHSILDPPYAKDVEDGNAAVQVRTNDFNFDAMTEDLRNRVAQATAAQTRRWALVFCSIEEAHLWRFALISAGMSYYRTGIYDRIGGSPQFDGRGPAQSFEAIVIAHSRVLPQRWNGGGKHARWSAPVVRGAERVHPTQKPSSLMRQLIEDFTDPGETIADPFAGVATTGVAAVGLGRNFVGWELDQEHHANGLKRMELPLFDRPLEQASLQINAPKGVAVRARMELDRKILNALNDMGADGAKSSDLATLVEDTPRVVGSSLKRLQKNGSVLRQGKTSQTRWISARHTGQPS